MSFLNPIVAGTQLIRSAVASPNFVAGQSGWIIRQDGSVEFGNAVIRGSIDHAATADNATSAGHANTADNATAAGHATSSDSATSAGHATSSDSATSAGHATSSDSATSAGAVNGQVRSSDMSATSPNYVPDGAGPGTGWSVNAAGQAVFNDVTVRGRAEGSTCSFNNGSFSNSLLYKGDELSKLLANNARGIIGFGQYKVQQTPATTTELAFLSLTVKMTKDRVYKIGLGPMRVSAANCGAVIRYTQPATAGGVAPAPSLTSTAYMYTTVDTAYNTATLENLFYPPLDGTYTFLLSLKSFSGTSATLDAGGTGYPYPTMWIEDVGPFTLNTGLSDPLSGTAASSGGTYYQFETHANAFRSYRGDGSYIFSDKLYQGNGPGGNGNMAGWAWFDMTQISGLNGAPASKLQYLDLYAYYDFWYAYAGGTAVFGWHNNTAVAPTSGFEPSGGFANVFQSVYNGRGIGKWISLFGTNIGAALLNGTFRGLVLGRGPTADYGYYGYSTNVAIRAGYYK